MTTTTEPWTIERVADKAREIKNESVAAFKEGDAPSTADVPPLGIAVRAGEIQAFVWGTLSHYLSGRRVGYWTAALWDADEVFLLADSLMVDAQVGDPEPEAGSLSERWQAGDRDGIREAITIYRFCPNGETDMLVHRYERDGNTIRWEDPAPPARSISGAIPDFVADGFADSAKKKPELEKMHAEIAAAADIPMDELMAAWRRARAHYVSLQEHIESVGIPDGDGGVEQFDHPEEPVVVVVAVPYSPEPDTTPEG